MTHVTRPLAGKYAVSHPFACAVLFVKVPGQFIAPGFLYQLLFLFSKSSKPVKLTHDTGANNALVKEPQPFNRKLQWNLLKKPFNINRDLAFTVASVQEIAHEFP